MLAFTDLLLAYFGVAGACLVLPALLAFFVPALGGPLVLRVLDFFFVRPFKLGYRLARSLSRADAAGERAPGWYDDPDDGERVRWWGGTSWTGFTQVGRVSKLRP